MATRAGTPGADFFRNPSAGPTLPGQIFLTDESDIAFGFDGNDTMIATNALSNVFYGGNGNDSLVGGSGGGTLLSGGEGSDTLRAGSGTTTMTGGAGSDQIFGGSAGDVALGGRDADTLQGEGGNDSLSGESGSDRLWGGEGEDSLDGGFDADTLDGGLGNDKVNGDRGDDSLIGGQGNDSLEGGAGFDVLSYAQETSIQRIVVTVQSGRVAKTLLLGGVATEQADFITGIESFIGTSGADRFIGWGQDEQFRGGAGNDSIDGGAGFDWARYDGATSGVVASLITGIVADGEGGTDRLRLAASRDNSIEVLVGGVHADLLTGDNDDNWLRGNLGADTLDGGVGFDMADYSGDADSNGDGHGVVVNLSAGLRAGLAGGTALDTSGAIDRLSGFEAVRGTAFRDHLIGGDTGGEQLRGMAGADTIEGGLGNDASVHRSDADADNDGYGVVVNLSSRQVTVTGFGAVGKVTLAAATARDGWGDIDTLLGIESAHGTFARDMLFGAARDIRLRLGEWTLAASDRSFLRGAEGADTLQGVHPDHGAVSDHRSDPGGIVARLDLGWVEDGWGFRDSLINIDAVSGSMMDDWITAGPGHGWMRGMAGDDTLQGGGGADFASYNGTGATAGIVVNLVEGWAEDGFGGLDLLIDIEGASGDSFADRLIGNAAANLLFGGRGADTLDGGEGSDWSHYYNLSVGVAVTASVEGVHVNLASGTARDGDGSAGGGSIDRLTSIENVLGSHLGDTLIGAAEANRLIGMEGDDRLDGAAGDDTLEGGAGADTLRGGTGADLLGGAAAPGATPIFAPTRVMEAPGDYEGSPMVADITGDGIPDLIQSGTVFIHDGLGGGRFAAARRADPASAGTVTIADLNGDGAPDLVLAAGLDGPLAVLLNDGAGQFTRVQALERAGAREVLAGDLNGDGRADVVLLDPSASGVVVRFGAPGAGGLGSAAAGAAGLAADDGAILDWEGDGDNDVVLVNGATGNMAVLRNDGTGALVALPTLNVLPPSTVPLAGDDLRIVVADLSGDGRPDFAAVTASGVVNWRVMTPEGTPGALGSIDLKTSWLPRQIIAADVDGDGRMDLLVNALYEPNTRDMRAVLLRNLGDGAFADPVVIADEWGATPWLVGDIDLDGLPDLLSTNWGSGDILIRSQQPPAQGEDEAGADLLDGGAGADTMRGGAGDDTYVVDDAGDRVVEFRGEGTDLVRSAVTLVLPDHLEDLVLTGTARINGTGNALANRITGNANANLLDGGAGADTLTGGAGNDIYVVDDAGDQVIETAGGGIDLVRSSASHALGAEVEQMLLLGTAAIDGIGNALANMITGNRAANVIDGRGGADTMAGGAGHDTYVVDETGDRVIEAAGEGIDEVRSSIDYVLGLNLEKLTLVGDAGIRGEGNAVANLLIGNAGTNLISGGAGDDSLIGAGGNDTLQGDAGQDSLVGGDGDDRLWGGAERDRLTGEAGRDAFIFAAPAESGDVITDFVAGLDHLEVVAAGFGAGLAPAMNLAESGRFVANLSGAADRAFGQFIYETDAGRFWWDADGTGAGARTLVATLTGTPALTAADVWVV